MRTLVATLFAIACSSSPAPNDPRSFNDCSWRDHKFGESTCDDWESGFFSCTCGTEKATCTFENFENGCSCDCIQFGTELWWRCIPDEESTLR